MGRGNNGADKVWTSTFIDTGISVAFANQSDRDHAQSRELMNRVRQGEFGVPYTSDGVFDETVTVALVHAGSRTTAIKVGKTILGSKEEAIPAWARLIRVDERIFAEA